LFWLMIYPFLDFAVFRKLYHGSFFIPNENPFLVNIFYNLAEIKENKK
jgi:hypothetical protein